MMLDVGGGGVEGEWGWEGVEGDGGRGDGRIKSVS